MSIFEKIENIGKYGTADPLSPTELWAENVQLSRELASMKEQLKQATKEASGPMRARRGRKYGVGSAKRKRTRRNF